MKKYIFIILLSFCMNLIHTDWSFAETGKTTVIVTEMIPGGNCRCYYDEGKAQYDDDGNKMPSGCDNNLVNRKYICEVSTGLAGFQSVFAEIIRYFIYIVLLLGVLGIVGLGIAWAFAGGDDIKAKSNLKTWGVNILIGLTILFLFSYILRFLAPWVYQ